MAGVDAPQRNAGFLNTKPVYGRCVYNCGMEMQADEFVPDDNGCDVLTTISPPWRPSLKIWCECWEFQALWQTVKGEMLVQRAFWKLANQISYKGCVSVRESFVLVTHEAQFWQMLMGEVERHTALAQLQFLHCVWEWLQCLLRTH